MNQKIVADKILKCRKDKNITQEQLASAVGVSAGAVCKWETGNSVPDIALLAPLARALGITIDELLSFTSELSEEEVKSIKQELISVFLNIGYEAGEDRCQKLLQEYPNSIYLKLIIANLYQIYAMMPENNDEALYVERLQHALALLNTVIESKDIKYTSQALFSIASIYMMLENYEESEKALKQLSDSFTDPMIIYPQLLLKQKKNTESKLLCKQILLARANQCMSILSTMSKIAYEEENQDEAYLFIDSMKKMQDIFKIGMNAGDYNLCRFYVRTNQPELAAKAFKNYVEGILSTDYDYSNHPFFKGIKLEVNNAGQEVIRKKMYQSQIESDEFNILIGYKDYDDAIELLKKHI